MTPRNRARPAARPLFMALAGMLAGIVAACGAGAGDKTGDESASPTALRLGIVEDATAPYRAQVEHFAAHVAELSKGTVRIDIVWNASLPFTGDTEHKIATQVRDGSLDLALVPSRTWDLLGVRSMEALQAPLLINNWDTLRAVATGDVAAQMMAGLTSIGVTPLAMWPESLRHPIGYDHPLTTSVQLRGAKLRVAPSRVADLMANSLGFTNLPYPGDGADGAESAFIWASELQRFGIFSGNVNWAAKVNTLVAHAPRFAALPAADRSLITSAAQDAINSADSSSTAEDGLATAYCALGGTVVLATDAELSQLRAAVAPVDADLRTDRVTAHAMDEIAALAATSSGAHAAVACRPPGSPSSRTSASSPPPAPISFPDGVYRTDSPVDGVVTFSMKGGVWQRIKADGTLDCEASYVVRGGRIYLTTSSKPGLNCGNPAGLVFLDAAWTLAGDRLRFTDIHSDPAAVTEFSLPWTKIG